MIANLLVGVAVLMLVAAAIESTRFAIRYARVDYRANPVGPHLLGMSRALAVALWGTLLFAAVQPPWWVGLTAQAAVFGWLAFEMNRRNRLFTERQRHGENTGG